MGSNDDTRLSPTPTPGPAQGVTGRQGVRLQKGLFLVPTSKVDGRKRWETIIRLLGQKARDKEVDELMVMLRVANEGAGK